MSNNKKKSTNYPFVSICTPTFNRRPFIPIMFECFKNQTYPKSRIEWIIVDDGTDKIKDLIDSANIPQIQYYEIPVKMSLGAKRNFCHSKCKGSIIVYMDDDDYYPPERISHAIDMLTINKHAMIAGSSEIYVYFKDIKKMYQFGPYGSNHATAGTFAFRKELLNKCKYEDNAALAEERHFLKDWTIPMVQLDPMKTILVFSHIHNTFNKRKLLENSNSTVVKESNKTVKMFIRDQKEEKIKQFFLSDIDHLLKKYSPGDPSMKPDVLSQIKEMDKKRKEMQQQLQQQQTIMFQESGKDPVPISLADTINIINKQNEQINNLVENLKQSEKIIEKLKSTKQNVSFSEPLIKPSFTVQNLLKEKDDKIIELEEKIKSLQDTIKQLENENKQISIIKEEKNISKNKIEQIVIKSKSEPEVKISIM